MDNAGILWASFVTQVITHLIAVACTSFITQDSIQVRTYSGWLCFLCIGAIGLLITGGSKYFSDLLDYMGYSLWKEPLWVMVCNIGVFSCVHVIYLIAAAELQPVLDAPLPHNSFLGPEGLDRGGYIVVLLVKLHAHRMRLVNNRRREEDYRVSAGELPPFLRAIGEDVDDPQSSETEDEDEYNAMLDDMPANPDFWNFFDPTEGSPTEYPIMSGDESGETVRPPDMRPRIRPENLYRRPVSIPGFPPQPLTRMRPATPSPPAEGEGRDGPTPRREGQPPTEGDRSVSPNTVRNYPFYAEFLRTRLVSPQLSITPPEDATPRPSRDDDPLPGFEELL